MSFAGVDTIVFDVYGTVVGWRSTIASAFSHLGEEKAVTADWLSLLDDLKAASRPDIEAVNRGERPWVTVKTIYCDKLEPILSQYGFNNLDEADWKRVVQHWNDHKPWPDAVPGMNRLSKKYLISGFSNGDFRSMAEIGRDAKLPWNAVLTADIVGKFKPHPDMYNMAINLLGRGDASRIMLVAAHNYDLAQGREHGMQTAFIPRPGEYEAANSNELEPQQDWDIIAESIEDLAEKLGC